jgi:tRNA modification GTPase
MRTGQRSDPIAAIATANGPSAIAVIRLSGNSCIELLDRVFRGGKVLASVLGNTIVHGRLFTGSGEEIDEVLVSVFRAPASYSGEDMVEIGCHGGMLVPGRVMELLMQSGFRAADRGEFTRRAFLNGKMDLSRAEAVMDVVTARSRAAGRASLAQLEGRLGTRVGELKGELVDVCALLELDLDFAEEGFSVAERGDLIRRLTVTKENVRVLASTFSFGRIARDGISVVFAGAPNAGKSSLFNALLKEARAIVAREPGTTRDTLEESVSIDGIEVRLIDTAGIREAEDIVELEGISRTMNAVRAAVLVAFVIDAENPGTGEAQSFLNEVRQDQRIIWVVNKIDTEKGRLFEIDSLLRKRGTVVRVSALSGEGLAELANAIALESGKSMELEPVVVTNARHHEALETASRHLGDAITSLERGESNEFAALDVREAVESLEDITGVITKEDVLNSIFASFCIGK